MSSQPSASEGGRTLIRGIRLAFELRQQVPDLLKVNQPFQKTVRPALLNCLVLLNFFSQPLSHLSNPELFTHEEL